MKTSFMKTYILLAVLAVMGWASSCVEPELDDYGTIHGMVTDAVSGSPIANASVMLSPGGLTTTTGSDGSFQYVDIVPGEYTVQVMANGYQVNNKSVTVEAGTVGRCDIQLQPGNGTLFIQNPNAQFGLTSISQSVLLRNTGTDRIEWSVEYVCEWIAGVSPSAGSIEPGGSATLTIRIDRSLIPDGAERSTTIAVRSTGGDATIYVSANGSEGVGDASGVVPAGLYAYYTFEDNARNVVGSGANASVLNPVYAAGAADGSKSVVLSAQSVLNIPEGMVDREEFAVSFWVKGLKAGHLFHVTTNASNSSGENNSFNLRMDNDGMLHFIIQNYNYWYPTYGNIPAFTHSYLSTGEWHHIVLSSEFGVTKYGWVNTKLYIDGEYADLVSEEVNPFDKKDYGAGIKFTMGGELFDEPAIDGLDMDNLRIYHRQLTDNEVATIYLAERGF